MLGKAPYLDIAHKRTIDMSKTELESIIKDKETVRLATLIGKYFTGSEHPLSMCHAYGDVIFITARVWAEIHNNQPSLNVTNALSLLDGDEPPVQPAGNDVSLDLPTVNGDASLVNNNNARQVQIEHVFDINELLVNTTPTVPTINNVSPANHNTVNYEYFDANNEPCYVIEIPADLNDNTSFDNANISPVNNNARHLESHVTPASIEPAFNSDEPSLVVNERSLTFCEQLKLLFEENMVSSSELTWEERQKEVNYNMRLLHVFYYDVMSPEENKDDDAVDTNHSYDEEILNGTVHEVVVNETKLDVHEDVVVVESPVKSPQPKRLKVSDFEESEDFKVKKVENRNSPFSPLFTTSEKSLKIFMLLQNISLKTMIYSVFCGFRSSKASSLAKISQNMAPLSFPP
jgi:hypothetical protein